MELVLGKLQKKLEMIPLNGIGFDVGCGKEEFFLDLEVVIFVLITS